MKSNNRDDLFRVPSCITRVTTTADNCLRMTLETTQELVAEEEAMVMRLRNKNGQMVFSPNKISVDDLPTEPAKDKTIKSSSQRMRAVLFVLWKEKKIQTDFELFYREKMEDIINKLKEQI